MTPTTLRVVLVTAILTCAAHAQATEVRIRIPKPASYRHVVQLKRARLLLVWWGDTRTVPLDSRIEGSDRVVTVPLDAEVWTSLGWGQPPDFAYVYLEFEDFVPVRSEQFYWLGGHAPALPPLNWQTVGAVRFGFRGGDSIDIRPGEQRELPLAVRLPASKQLRFVADSGYPVTEILVDGGMFWSSNNHCGVQNGLEPLFENLRPNADGLLTVPDGDIQYGIHIRGAHITVVEPRSSDDWLSKLYGVFTTYIDAPELVVRVHRNVLAPLTLRVTLGGRPAGGITIAASVPACGNGTGPLGRTDDEGVLRLPDFYPEEFDAICIDDADGQPIWAVRPDGRSEIAIDLPETARVGGPGACYVR